jgi:hypothetical protein
VDDRTGWLLDDVDDLGDRRCLGVARHDDGAGLDQPWGDFARGCELARRDLAGA